MGVQTVSYFFSIYFKDELSSQGATWKASFDIGIRKALTNLFDDVEPILHPAPPALGIPEEIINDISLISLVSKDGFHECSATKKKINFNNSRGRIKNIYRKLTQNFTFQLFFNPIKHAQFIYTVSHLHNNFFLTSRLQNIKSR